MRLKDINNATLIWGPVSPQGCARLKKDGRLVVVPEIRPGLIGLKHNAVWLKKEGVRFVYCADSIIGSLFYKNKIKKTLLFYKKVEDRKVIGISGFLYAALLSKLHKVPIAVLPQGNPAAGADKDASSLGGKKIVLEAGGEFIVAAADEAVEEEVLG